MFQLIASVLAWYYSVIPNYAIAIALLTLTIMVILTPLTLKSTKSMLELQRHQPEMKRIQQQYKGDRQKLNEEMMKFYQEHKINPLGGCLPLLLQMPVFFILYRVLHKLTETCAAGDIPKECTTVGNFKPSYLSHDTDLWKSLTSTSEMNAFGMDLSQSATHALSDSVLHGLPYLVLVAAVAATSFYQQRQITSRNKNQVVNPQQQMIMKIMPAFMAIISLALPAGLVVYFLISNLYRVGQQGYITRKFYKEDHKGDGGGNGAEPKKPKPAPTPERSAKPTPKSAPAKAVTTPTKGKPTPARSGPAAKPAPSKPTPKRPVPTKPAPPPKTT